MCLSHQLQSDTSGDYRNTLLALINGGPPPESAAKCKLQLIIAEALTDTPT